MGKPLSVPQISQNLIAELRSVSENGMEQFVRIARTQIEIVLGIRSIFVVGWVD